MKNSVLVFAMFIHFAFLFQNQNNLYALDETILDIETLEDFGNDSINIINWFRFAEEMSDAKPGDAKEMFRKISHLAQEYSGKFYIGFYARSNNRLGIISTIQGDHSIAMEYYQNALRTFNYLKESFPENSDYLEGMVGVLGNMGSIYYHQGNHEKAIEYWQKCLHEIKLLHRPMSEGQLLNNIGVVYKETGKRGKALEYYKLALGIFEGLGEDKQIAMSYTNIGEIYDLMGLYPKALELMQKSLEIKETLDDKYGMIQSLAAIANLCYNMNDHSASLEYANRCLIIAESINAKADMRNAYELLSKNFASLNNYKKAYEMHLSFKSMNDSIFNEISHKNIIEVQTKYETERKEKEIELFREREIYQKTLRRFLIIGILLVLLFSIFMIRSILVKRRKEKIIYQQDKKLLEKEKLLMQNNLEKQQLKTNELNKEIDFKTRQLTTHALNMMQKNEMLKELNKSIEQISKNAGTDIKAELRKLKRKVAFSLKTEKDWEVFKLYFEQVNTDFFNELLKLNATLNNHDLRHCALIKLNLNIKETASVLNLSPNSIKSARYRLKKKLNLDPVALCFISFTARWCFLSISLSSLGSDIRLDVS